MLCTKKDLLAALEGFDDDELLVCDWFCLVPEMNSFFRRRLDWGGLTDVPGHEDAGVPSHLHGEIGRLFVDVACRHIEVDTEYFEEELSNSNLSPKAREFLELFFDLDHSR